MKQAITTLTLMAAMTVGSLHAQTVTDSTATIDSMLPQGSTRVQIHTRLGDITLRLYDATPLHRDNFIRLVKEGVYNGTLFHRVIKDFMVQGGDPATRQPDADSPQPTVNTDYTIEPEIKDGLYHKRGALAAAREGDATNPERRSSASQFYIVWGRTFSPRQIEYLAEHMDSRQPGAPGLTPQQCSLYATLGGTPHLDGLYTVFGEVEEGLDVVERIQSLPTTPSDRPIDPVAMTVTILP